VGVVVILAEDKQKETCLFLMVMVGWLYLLQLETLNMQKWFEKK
jgi:hypothetical protein